MGEFGRAFQLVSFESRAFDFIFAFREPAEEFLGRQFVEGRLGTFEKKLGQALLAQAAARTLGDGGDFETTPESLTGLIEGEGDTIELTAPSAGGAYRLFIYADDGNGHTAHANIPFLVN